MTTWLSTCAMALFFWSSCTPTLPPVGPSGPNPNPSGLAYKEIPDTAYGESPLQRLDIYLPANRNSQYTPVIIMVHGGGWSSGYRSEMSRHIAQFKTKWPEAAIVNISYRLVTTNPAANQHPAQMQDIRKVLDWLDRSSSALAISRKYGIMGESAGAHLSTLYAYGFDPEKRIKAVGDIYGPSDLTNTAWTNFPYNIVFQSAVNFTGVSFNNTTLQQYRDVSPFYRATAQSVPTIIFHGTGDLVVPFSQGQILNARLQQLGVQHEYHEYNGAGHAVDFNNIFAIPQEECDIKLTNFFKRFVQ
jgi:acetyl esterase/lipase